MVMTDIEAGLKAAQTGDYEKAYNIWMPLAEAGNPYAQLNIGVMYRLGLYVEPDIRAGDIWIDKALETGDPNIIKAVDMIDRSEEMRILSDTFVGTII